MNLLGREGEIEEMGSNGALATSEWKKIGRNLRSTM